MECFFNLCFKLKQTSPLGVPMYPSVQFFILYHFFSALI